MKIISVSGNRKQGQYIRILGGDREFRADPDLDVSDLVGKEIKAMFMSGRGRIVGIEYADGRVRGSRA